MPNWNPADDVRPGIREPSGETRTVASTGDGSDTGDRPNGIPGSAPGMGVALMAHEASGPIHLGHKSDKHRIGMTKDGEPINAAHVSTEAYFYDDQERDAPLYFEGSYPQNIPAFPLKAKVHLAYDDVRQHPFVGGSRQGLWRWWAEVPYMEAPKREPPPTGEGPPPTTPGTGKPVPPTQPSGPSTPGSGGPASPPPTSGGNPPTGGGSPNGGGGPSGGGPGGGREDQTPEGAPPATTPPAGHFQEPYSVTPQSDFSWWLNQAREREAAAASGFHDAYVDPPDLPKAPGGGGSGPSTGGEAGDNGKNPPSNDGPSKGGDDDSGDSKDPPEEKDDRKSAADHIHAWGTVGDPSKKKAEAEAREAAVMKAALAKAHLPSSGGARVTNGTSVIPPIVIRNYTPYFWDPAHGVYRAPRVWHGPGYGKSSGGVEVSTQARPAGE